MPGLSNFITAVNIAGTPCKPVQRSSFNELITAAGSNVSLGKTMDAPWLKTASTPRTSPKQWNIGGGQQMTSFGVSNIRSPTNWPSFTTLLKYHLVELQKTKFA